MKLMKRSLKKVALACVKVDDFLQKQLEQFIKALNKLRDKFIDDVQSGKIPLEEIPLNEHSSFLSGPVAELFNQWLNPIPTGLDPMTWVKNLNTIQIHWYLELNDLIEQSTLKNIDCVATTQTFKDICLEKRKWLKRFSEENHSNLSQTQKKKPFIIAIMNPCKH